MEGVNKESKYVVAEGPTIRGADYQFANIAPLPEIAEGGKSISI